MIANNKQFIIYNEKISCKGFESVELSTGLFLSYESHLKVEKLYNGMIILGEAISLNPEATEKLGKIINPSIDEVADIMQFFSGRWALIWNNCIMSDACALMGLFYSTDCVSSSLNLIFEHTSHKNINTDFRKPSYGDVVDWVVSPGTKISDVKRMLCSQYIAYNESHSFEARHYDFVKPHFSINATYVEEELIKCSDIYFKTASKLYDSLVLPFTAGVDSRTLFALLIHSGVEFTTITFDRKSMCRSDHNVPDTLSSMYDIPYRYILGKEEDCNLRKLWNIHTFESCASEDENFLAQGQFFSISESALLIRGNIWELAGCYWWNRLGNVKNVCELKEAVLLSMPEMKVPSFDDWLEDVKSYPRPLDLRDAIYYEQRLGAWLSSIEQGLDILPFSHLAPINSAYLLSLTLSLPIEERTGKKFQRRLINSLLPELSGIPYNSKTPIEWMAHYLNQGMKLISRVKNKIC